MCDQPDTEASLEDSAKIQSRCRNRSSNVDSTPAEELNVHFYSLAWGSLERMSGAPC